MFLMLSEARRLNMSAQAMVMAEDKAGAHENKYSLAGWIAITQAIIFPAMFAVGLFERIIVEKAFGPQGPMFGLSFGLSDVMSIAFTGMAVYTLSKFRELFKEYHNYTAIDVLLVISIWWAITFQVGGLLLLAAHMVLGPVSELATGLVYGSFLGVFMIAIGVVDIIIGIRILREGERFSQLIRAFGYVSLIAGIAEVSVIFVPLSLILVPVSLLIMGLIFLREKHEVEFV
jgi:hypothetical protein